MDLKTFTSAVMEIAEERGISQEKIIEVIETALASAYKKEYGKKKQKFEAKLDSKTGKVKFWQVKQVVDKDMVLSEEELVSLPAEPSPFTKELGKAGAEGLSTEQIRPELTAEGLSRSPTADKEKIRFNPERHIMIEEAKKIKPKIKEGEELKIPVKAKEDFGRIAAQTAKQVILQKIKEVEREEILKEYKEKEGEIVSGICQRVEQRVVFFDIGKTSGILQWSEQIPGEFYKPGQRLKLYILKIEESPKGPVIFLSRAYPKLVSKLFELEVPEISSGQVEIKSIAREPASRSKIAVTATEEGIDPIGSMVGQKGTRIWAVINELGGEKIDVIEWDEKAEKYIANALSPAKVLEVRILPKNKAQAIVPDDQLSLAIGKEGQNVRLAAKLTGWKIDVRSLSQIERGEVEPASLPAEAPAGAKAGKKATAGKEVKEEKKEKKAAKKKKVK